MVKIKRKNNNVLTVRRVRVRLSNGRYAIIHVRNMAQFNRDMKKLRARKV